MNSSKELLFVFGDGPSEFVCLFTLFQSDSVGQVSVYAGSEYLKLNHSNLVSEFAQNHVVMWQYPINAPSIYGGLIAIKPNASKIKEILQNDTKVRHAKENLISLKRILSYSSLQMHLKPILFILRESFGS